MNDETLELSPAKLRESQFYKDQVKTELVRGLAKDYSRRLMDEDRLQRAMAGENGRSVGEPGLVYDPLPEAAPELIPGLLPQYGSMAIVGETNTGKAEPVDAPILTPNGYVRMGDLRVGDAISTHDGTQSTILAVHPRGIRQVYKLTFSDGRTAEACADHLWRVHHPNWTRTTTSKGKPRNITGPKLMSTAEIMKMSRKYWKRCWIDLPLNVDFGRDVNLPIDPWLLGVLLGDGSITQNHVAFTSADQFIVDGVTAALPEGMSITKRQSKYGYGIVDSGGPNRIKEYLKALGIDGCRSYEKFIPTVYMNSSRNQRLALLQGLMDTDGYADKQRGLSYSTSSQMMASQVASLVRSLGGVCKTTSSMASYTKNGVKKFTRTTYDLWISHENTQQFVRLPRKNERLSNNRRKPRLKFVSIEPSRVTETRCITVSHPDGLYITDDYVVTHNSLISLEICSSLLTGEPLWGKLYPNKTIERVTYVLGEHTCTTIQSLYHKTQLPHKGDFRLIGPEHLNPYKALVVGGVAQQMAIDRLVKWTEGSGLVVFDPLAGFVQGLGGEQDNATMRTLIDALTYIADVNGAACLILAHMGKPRMDESGAMVQRSSYAMRGASSQEDALTHVFYLTRPNVRQAGDGLFNLEVRKFKGDPSAREFKLHRDPDTLRHSLDGQGMVSVRLSPEDKAILEAKYERLRADNPKWNKTTLIRTLASTEGQQPETIKQWLTQAN